MTQLESLYQAVLEGDAPAAKAGVQAALGAGVAPEVILSDGLISAMAEVGRLFEENEYFVPEMLVSARAMQAGLVLLKPHLADAGAVSAGKVVVGTVKGDLHDIGKNLVAMMLEGAGFEVVDLGTDVTPDKFVKAVQEHKPQVIGMSRPAHHDHAVDDRHDQGARRGRAARPSQGHDRRRARDGRVCQADRRGRLQPRCVLGRSPGESTLGIGIEPLWDADDAARMH